MMMRFSYKLFFLVLTLVIIYACGINKTPKKITLSFTSQQSHLITAGDSLTPMRVYKITNPTDSFLLRMPSTKVNPNPDDPILNLFVKRLYRTVRDSLSLGVGIAAPQVGILKQIIWVQRFDKSEFPFEVYLNPVITHYSEQKQDCLEGCLSIPDRRDTTTTRAETIYLEYDQLNGQHKKDTVEGFTAVIFQHEIDHLNGILYLDHLEKESKK